MLPAALVAQVQSCEPLLVTPGSGAGWQVLGTCAGGSVIRVCRSGPESPWQARWIAVLRRAPGAAGPRPGVLLSAAPELLPPLGAAQDFAVAGRDGLGEGEVALTLGTRRLVVPDVSALQATEEPA